MEMEKQKHQKGEEKIPRVRRSPDTSFNELLSYLATTYPMGNKVPANTYHAKKLIRPVAMKLRKFDAYPNHCILYQGKEYENMTSCPYCGASRYKRNAGCRVDEDDNVALRGGLKRKKGAKKSSAATNRISSLHDEEEEGYTRRKSLTLLLWYPGAGPGHGPSRGPKILGVSL